MAFDAFLKIQGGPNGESTDSKHTNEIELAGFELLASNPSSIGSSTGGTGTGRVKISGLKIRKKIDASSPVLFQACCTGAHYQGATLTVRKSGGTSPLEYLTYTLTQVYVDSVLTHGNGKEDDTVMEEIVLSFGSIHEKYVPQKSDGTGGSPQEGGYDLVANKPK